MATPTLTQLQALLDTAGETISPSADLSGAIAAAIAEVSRQTGRTFSSAAAARRFDGTGTETLWIPPCSSITAVERVDAAGTVVETYAAGVGYLAYPEHESTKTRLVRLPGWSSFLDSEAAVWPAGRQAIRVTATWGEAMPEDLRMATLYLAANDLHAVAVEAAQGGLKKIDNGTDSQEYDTERKALRALWRDRAAGIIASYQRIDF